VEVLRIRLVHLREVGKIREEDGGLHQIVEAPPCGFEHRLEAQHHAIRLRRDVSLHELAARRVEGKLPREEQHARGRRADGLAVRSDRLGRLRALHRFPRDGGGFGRRRGLHRFMGAGSDGERRENEDPHLCLPW
jgi:hypothetical protein